TLTVFQKDAYSDVAGRSSLLWPPHTTTVFRWDEGVSVQVNHGAAPDDTDDAGNIMLVSVKEYRFSGTHDELQALEKAYNKAIYDDDEHKFLTLTDAKSVFSKALIIGIAEAIEKDDNLICDGTMTKDEIVTLLKSGDPKKIGEAIPELTTCNWHDKKWHEMYDNVLREVFSNLGEDLLMYHTCNDDAEMQVGLINNFISSHEIKIPEKVDNGPRIYYFPI
ncbi:MAG: hypothetical protein KAH10_07615, partial [Flavobacteriales bacterium]|nr:hypothetical protein [Flavobacteriales bacterium]